MSEGATGAEDTPELEGMLKGVPYDTQLLLQAGFEAGAITVLVAAWNVGMTGKEGVEVLCWFEGMPNGVEVAVRSR